MTFFLLACLLVAGVAVLLEVTTPEGVLTIGFGTWLGMTAGLAVWLAILAA